jgi:integrase
MASIVKINGKWRAVVRRKGHSPISKYFDTKGKATIWATGIEAQMTAAPTVNKVNDMVSISDALARYRQLRSTQRPIMDTSSEHYTIKMLAAELGQIPLHELSVDDVLSFAHKRRSEKAGPYTVLCDLSKLGTILRYTFPNALPVLAEARPKLAYLGLIGGGGKRERRPTEEESLLLLQWLEKYKGAQYRDFVEFSAITAMRRGEVAKAKWEHLNEPEKMLYIKDRKDPRKKVGNDQWIPLLGRSFEIVLKQERQNEFIFNICERTMSKYFKAACDALGIPDLHLHDMRHEGISRMFEDGLEIQHVSLVSGHKSWQHLKRYTNLKPESLHALHQDKLKRQEDQTNASHHPGMKAP